MKKKIYTLTLILVAVLSLLYFVWAWAANIQKEVLKKHLSSEWALNLSDENITAHGFPFKFAIKMSNFNSRLKDTPLRLEFLRLEIVRLIYNFSDVILFLDKPMITSMNFPKFNISSNKLKASISNRPFSGRFKLITEQEDWQVSDDRNLKRIEAKKVIFALKDADEMNLDFYFQASNLGFSFLHKIQGKGPEKQNNLILKGAIFNSGMGGLEERYQPIKLRTIMLEQLNMDLGFFELHCNDIVAVNFLKFTTEDDVDCLLKLSSKDISKIKTDDVSIQRIINFVKLLLIINNTTKPAEPQPIPIKLSLNKGLLYINAIPIYQFPTQY